MNTNDLLFKWHLTLLLYIFFFLLAEICLKQLVDVLRWWVYRIKLSGCNFYYY